MKRFTSVVFIVIVLIIMIGFTILYFKQPSTVLGTQHKTFQIIERNNGVYQFSGDTLNYSMNRSIPKYQMTFLSENNSVKEYAINFMSRPFLNHSTKIFGLLFIPGHHGEIPGVVFLPGGGVTKWQEAPRAQMIAEQGYAVLTIDQRGINQTGGYYLGPQQDFQVFARGYEPIQHLSVYDGLRSFDVLRTINGVNASDIVMAGESMGGRYAMIATALDSRIKGVIIISSSGFGIPEKLSNPVNDYMVSIDPDHYISHISPRSVYMLQGNNDTVVSLKAAEKTYSLAGQPKGFFIAKGCGHGYCDIMHDALFADLQKVLG